MVSSGCGSRMSAILVSFSAFNKSTSCTSSPHKSALALNLNPWHEEAEDPIAAGHYRGLAGRIVIDYIPPHNINRHPPHPFQTIIQLSLQSAQ